MSSYNYGGSSTSQNYQPQYAGESTYNQQQQQYTSVYSTPAPAAPAQSSSSSYYSSGSTQQYPEYTEQSYQQPTEPSNPPWQSQQPNSYSSGGATQQYPESYDSHQNYADSGASYGGYEQPSQPPPVEPAPDPVEAPPQSTEYSLRNPYSNFAANTQDHNMGGFNYGEHNPYGKYHQPDLPEHNDALANPKRSQKKRPFPADEPERPAKRVRDRSRSRSPRRDRREETQQDTMDIHAQLLGLSNAKMSAKRQNEADERSKREAKRNESEEREAERTKKDLERRSKVDFEHYDAIPVHVKPAPGKKLPPAMRSFQQLGLHPDLQRNLNELNFTKPTPIQKHAIPVILSKQDVMATAQTGSGKTLAFLCPIIHGILSAGEVPRPFLAGKMAFASPLALIVAPTRELAIQIDEETWKLTEGTDLSSFAVFGGENFNDQANQIQKGQIDILCATPGRLLDMLSSNKISLNYVRYLALDEADNILDLGLEQQIREIIEERDLPRKEDRVTMLFSATFPSKIRELAKTFLRPHVFISVGKVGSTTTSIQQDLKWVEESSKKSEILSDLKAHQEVKPGKIIVFVARRVTADHVAKFLASNSFTAASLHGKQDQWMREETIMKFKDDKFRILVATSVAARGLDFPDITLVVNYDFPGQLADYTHRIGRTGRMGSKGKAISYLNRSNMSVAGKLKEYLKKHKQPIPHWLMFQGRRRY